MKSPSLMSEKRPATSAVTGSRWARHIQIGWMMVGIVLITWGLRLWGSGTAVAWAPLPSTILSGTGLALVALATLVRNRSHWRIIEWVAVILVVAGLLFWTGTQIVSNPSYMTDEMAFDQWAATLWVHGINPYGHSLAAAFNAYQVSPDRFTWTLSGKPVTLLSYPALAFEVYAPAIALGWTNQVAVWFNVLAWAVGMVLAFAIVPSKVRPWILVLASLSVYIGFAQGGVTDALYIPFLVLAAWRWDRYPQARGWAAIWPPIVMGLALGIKQTPWIIWPFLVMGFIGEARALGMNRQSIVRMVWRYTWISGAVFFVPNLPFIVDNPGTWLHGVLAPLLSKTVPDGQGLITLSLFEPWGSGSLHAFTWLSIVVLLFLLVVYPLTYPRLKSLTFLFPAIALFFATRSFASYLLMLIPVTVVAVATTRVSKIRTPLTPRRKQVVIGGLGLSLILMTAAVALPGPVGLQLDGLHTSGLLATVDRVTVTATNHGNQAVHPHFTANIGGVMTAFWTPIQGPPSLGPHQSATYTLAAPNFGAMPPISGGFQIMAFTAKSETVTRTPIVLPNSWHLSVVPSAVNKPVPNNHVIVFTVQILNRWNQPVRAGGIPVYFGQVIYTQRGPQTGQSVINHGFVGQTPVKGLTNNLGQARFTVKDVTPTADPIYYEANLVNSQNFYPFGFSQMVPVRFVK